DPTPEPTSIQNEGYVGAMAYSPDGKILAVGDGSSTKLWDITATRQLAKLPFAGIAAFSHDGKTLAIGSTRSVELVAVVKGEEQGAIQVHTSRIGSLAFGPDVKDDPNFVCGSLAFGLNDKTLAMAGMGVTARLWDLSSRQLRGTLDGI